MSSVILHAVALKKVAENSAVLASQQKQLQTLAIRLNTLVIRQSRVLYLS